MLKFISIVAISAGLLGLFTFIIPKVLKRLLKC